MALTINLQIIMKNSNITVDSQLFFLRHSDTCLKNRDFSNSGALCIINTRVKKKRCCRVLYVLGFQLFRIDPLVEALGQTKGGK